MSTITDLAQSIATMEGYFRGGTLAQKNNNPGNLRAGPSAIGKDSNGLAIYATAQDGWNDLYRQIGLDAGRGLSLAQFIGKYAPPNENNTSGYLSFVSSSIGVDPSTPLAQLGASDPANPPTAPRHRAGGPATTLRT
jgi:hypothetical protein